MKRVRKSLYRIHVIPQVYRVDLRAYGSGRPGLEHGTRFNYDILCNLHLVHANRKVNGVRPEVSEAPTVQSASFPWQDSSRMATAY